MVVAVQPRMSERPLADIAVIKMPRSIKDEEFKGIRDEQAGRLTFTFSSPYFWASFGGITKYKQQLFVSVMGADATAEEYAALPRHFAISYDPRKTIRSSALGSGQLTVIEGVYYQTTMNRPAHTFVYADRTRRLQLVWHAVTEEIDLATGIEAIKLMAESFRMVRDPAPMLADIRDRPRREAEDRARKRTMALAMLEREGIGPLDPGTPKLWKGAYVEWMAEPEPRYQLLVPLGRVRVGPNTSAGMRPRPLIAGSAGGPPTTWAGAVGWQERADGDDWDFSNRENAYLPFPGIRRILLAQQHDPAFVYFYYSATVRVEEAEDDRVLNSVRWFLDDVPDVQRLWREGRLVTGGKPEPR